MKWLLSLLPGGNILTLLKYVAPVVLISLLFFGIWSYFHYQANLVQGLQDTVVSLNTKITDLEKEKTQLIASNDTLQKEIAAQKENFNQYIEQLLQANTELAQGQMSIEALQKQLKDSQEQIDRIRKSKSGSEKLLNLLNSAQDCALLHFDKQGECKNGKFIPR